MNGQLFRPSELHQLLGELSISPNKQLSQNFLIDGNIVAKILKSAAVEECDHVLEIGPGPGALTEALLQTGAEVIAVEKDKKLCQSLQRLSSDHLQLFCEDIRTFSFEKHLSRKCKTKVVANLPYHLTSPILTKICRYHTYFCKLTIMVQEEVANRMVASCGDPAYGALSLFMRFYAEPIDCFRVSPNSFYPKPRVKSSVVTFAFREPPDVDEKAFFHLTRNAFSQRRKMLRSALRSSFPPEKIETALDAIDLPRTARAEELSLEKFLALFHQLKKEPSE